MPDTRDYILLRVPGRDSLRVRSSLGGIENNCLPEFILFQESVNLPPQRPQRNDVIQCLNIRHA